MKQDYKNHSKLVPLFHYVLCPLILILLIGSIVNLYQHWSDRQLHVTAALLVLVGIITSISVWYIRTFALKAQDRAIRAEENLRHFALTGKLLDSRLMLSQVIALRFAPDEEFVRLAKRAAENNMSNKEIKQAIIRWKADLHRV